MDDEPTDSSGPIERLIDVGGYRLSIRTVGQGSPAVVCVPALGGAHDDWLDVASILAETTTVVTYARPGLAGSDQLPADEAAVPRDGAWVATQLRTLLRNADVPPPYVLTSGSIGAFVVDQFAATWPDEVMGLVLNDPTSPRLFVGLDNPQRIYDSDDGTLPDADAGGITFSGELLKGFLTVPAPTNRDDRFVVISAAVGSWLNDEPQDWHVPLTVAELDTEWQTMQGEWADRLQAPRVVAHTAEHHVYRDEPQLTATVVRAVVEAARAGRRVILDEDQLAAVGGRSARRRT